MYSFLSIFVFCFDTTLNQFASKKLDNSNTSEFHLTIIAISSFLTQLSSFFLTS